MLRKIQEEQKPWVKHNFPGRKDYEPLIGIIEELGELSHAHLKEIQGIRTNENHIENARDAVADIVIYIADYCSGRGYDLQGIYKKASIVSRSTIEELGDATGYQIIFYISSSVGKLARHYLMNSQESEKNEIGNILLFLIDYCIIRDFSFEHAVQETWDKVKQRDWKKDSESAGEK